MSDYDRARGERGRPREWSGRADRGYGYDRPPRDEAREGYRGQQSGRDVRGERDREPGAMDLAFGGGLGSGYSGRDRSGQGDRQQGGVSRGYGADYGRFGSGHGDERYGDRAGSYRNDVFARDRGEPDATGYRGERGFLERAGDEMASWFGDTDASRRRRQDARQGDQGAQHHAGKGPRNYQRSDDRIREDINDRLTDDRDVDATDIEVTVQSREVTLSGTVSDRYAKRRAEDVAESVSGIAHVQNNLRVRQVGSPDASGRGEAPGGPATGTGSTSGGGI